MTSKLMMTQVHVVADCTNQEVRHRCHGHRNFWRAARKNSMRKALPDQHLTLMASLDVSLGPAAYLSIAKDHR